jgi:hypothetical protein
VVEQSVLGRALVRVLSVVEQSVLGRALVRVFSTVLNPDDVFVIYLASVITHFANQVSLKEVTAVEPQPVTNWYHLGRGAWGDPGGCVSNG